MEISDWGSYHFFYHGDRIRLLRDLVRPLLRSLLAADRIESFFFIHYRLGGPHVRLRLRWASGSRATGEAEVLQVAQDFFARFPSTATLPEETLRQQNRGILATDPSEEEDAVYPDNSCVMLPFRPETERYGGAALLGASLDFFALSSLLALRFAALHGGAPREQQLPKILRLLVRQAWGLARGDGELLRLLSYAPETDRLASVVEKGERVFDRQRELFCGLVEAALEETDLPDWDLQAARLLARDLQPVDETTRWRIAASQMHMTANRLGLTNLEEVYLGRIARRSAETLLAAKDEFRRHLRPVSLPEPEDGLPDLLRRALSEERDATRGDLG